MKKFHISWMIGKTNEGTDLSTGKTYDAESMEDALRQFREEHPTMNPLYCLQK